MPFKAGDRVGDPFPCIEWDDPNNFGLLKAFLQNISIEG